MIGRRISLWLKGVGARFLDIGGTDRARRVRLWVLGFFIVTVVAPAFLILVYRIVPPPVTPLMVIRVFEGRGLNKDWVPLEQISLNLQRAVIASEDAKFCTHQGFDWAAVDKAVARNKKKNVRIRGASTISMQTAKNLFLWPNRNFIRKGLEAYLTVGIELLLPKQRILELYLNSVEWGPGLYGAEAASRKFFGIPASKLSVRQAALLATVLPNPLRWSPSKPGPWTSERAGTIQARMSSVPWSRQDGICP